MSKFCHVSCFGKAVFLCVNQTVLAANESVLIVDDALPTLSLHIDIVCATQAKRNEVKFRCLLPDFID